MEALAEAHPFRLNHKFKWPEYSQGEETSSRILSKQKILQQTVQKNLFKIFKENKLNRPQGPIKLLKFMRRNWKKKKNFFAQILEENFGTSLSDKNLFLSLSHFSRKIVTKLQTSQPSYLTLWWFHKMTLKSHKFVLKLLLYCITSKKTAKHYVTSKYIFVEYFEGLDRLSMVIEVIENFEVIYK